MKPKSLKELAHVIGKTSDCDKIVSGVCVDTRLLLPGDLFFALPGANVDGHAFIESAALGGASGAVVHDNYEGSDFGLSLISVKNVLEALQTLAKEYLKQHKASIVAITGSLGKTTTKEFTTTLLKTKFKVSASPGNSNSQIGLPLALLNHTSEEDEIIILEMGMTHPGQLSKLIEIAPPDVAVITKVALVHAENFDSLEEIAKSKAEIFKHPETRCGIYALDSNIHQALTNSGNCAKQSFSTSDSSADFFLKNSKEGNQIQEAGKISVDLPNLRIPGAHNQHNFLAAIAVARFFGLTWQEIKTAQPLLELPERRLQFIEKQGILFINDSYNASEASMKAALDSLPFPKAGGRLIAFFGGIVELGKFSEDCHRAVGKHALNCVDAMFCFGEDCLPIFEEWELAKRPVTWAKDKNELALALKKHLHPGDVVLLKGSRAKGVWKVLDAF